MSQQTLKYVLCLGIFLKREMVKTIMLPTQFKKMDYKNTYRKEEIKTIKNGRQDIDIKHILELYIKYDYISTSNFEYLHF